MLSKASMEVFNFSAQAACDEAAPPCRTVFKYEDKAE